MGIKKVLSGSLVLNSNRLFPSSASQKSIHPYQCVLGVGGNVGDVKRRLARLYHFFKRDKRVALIETSPVLKNPPFGFLEQDDFYNCVIVLRTSMCASEFLAYILRVEKHFGRRRSFPNAPRTLDLDILFFDNQKIETKDLIVPHPHWKERESVLIPLSYLKRNKIKGAV